MQEHVVRSNPWYHRGQNTFCPRHHVYARAKRKRSRMEKAIEEVLENLIRRCGLGKIMADVEPVTGGLMHRIYKVTTDSGVYAVKHLNAEIMKRPDVHANFARAEKIEGILEIGRAHV